jgi:hypothetical protein
MPILNKMDNPQPISSFDILDINPKETLYKNIKYENSSQTKW